MAMYYTPIPHDFLEEMGELSDAEYGRLIRWCQTYSITGEEMELSGNERFFRMRCKKQIDKVKESYEELSQKRSEAGKIGMEKRWHSDNKAITNDNSVIDVITNDNTAITNITNRNINKNKNINKNINIKEKDDAKASSKKKAVITAWNDAVANSIVPELRVLNSDSTRYKMLNARIKEYSLDQVLEAIKSIEDSNFLRTATWFNFDWFIKPNNFIKVYEGNYKDEEPKGTQRIAGNSETWEDIAQALNNRT